MVVIAFISASCGFVFIITMIYGAPEKYQFRSLIGWIGVIFFILFMFSLCSYVLRSDEEYKKRHLEKK